MKPQRTVKLRHKGRGNAPQVLPQPVHTERTYLLGLRFAILV